MSTNGDTPMAEGPMSERKFGDVLARTLHQLQMDTTAFHKAVGLGWQTIDDAIVKHAWTKTSRKLVSDYLESRGVDRDVVEMLRLAPTTKRHRTVHPKSKRSSLWCGLTALEKAKPWDREEALHSAFAAATPECNAFISIMSFGVLPSPFDPAKCHDRIRRSLYGAHDNRLMAFFVMPDEDRVARTRKKFGKHAAPSLAKFRDGYKLYRDGYIRWCRERGVEEPERAAEERIGAVEYNDFEIISWRYITCYAGVNPSDSYGNVKARLIERGPSNDNKITVQAPDLASESGMRKYLGWVIEETEEQTNPFFRDEIARRMQVRR